MAGHGHLLRAEGIQPGRPAPRRILPHPAQARIPSAQSARSHCKQVFTTEGRKHGENKLEKEVPVSRCLCGECLYLKFALRNFWRKSLPSSVTIRHIS